MNSFDKVFAHLHFGKKLVNFKKSICIVFSFFTGVAAHGQMTDTGHRTISDSTINGAIDTQSIAPFTIKRSYSDTSDNTSHKKFIIHGKIEDARTKEGIPFATFYIFHSSLGASADIDGNFIFTTDRLPSDTFRIEALGYRPEIKTIGKGVYHYSFTAELERSTNTLSEVTIHAGEDPAILLMRHIIERKPYNNPDRLENYRYEAHNKMEADLQHMTKHQFSKIPILKSYRFIFDSLETQTDAKDYVPLYLTESISDYYFQRKPKRQREFIKAIMVKGVNNQGVDKYLGSLYQSINIYRNYIPVFDKKYVSPINNDALLFYRYKIMDTLHEYRYNIIIMHFWPRREGENCFTGDFGVVDSVYSIQHVSMDVPKTANINWVTSANIYQEFAPVDSIWFCVEDKFTAAFAPYNSKKLPGTIGRKTTNYHNIVINDTSVTKVLDNPKYREEVIVSDSARKRSDNWWAENRPDSLTKNEKRIYKMVDTINSMPITNVYKNILTFLISGVKDFGPIELGPYFNIYSQNSVEGNRLRISLGTPRKIKDIHVTGFVAYGTEDQKYKYGLTGLWILKRHPWMQLYGYYIHDIDQRTNYYDQLGSDNIFSTLLRKPGIPWKLAFSDEKRIEWYKQYFSGFSHKFILQYRDYTPYAPLPSIGIFYDNNGRPSNSVISSEAGIELRYAYKEKFIEGLYTRLDIGSKYPIWDLQITSGFKGILNSGYAYQKARFAVSEDINIPPLGHLYWNAFSGKYFGTLPYPLLEIHPGNEYYTYNPFAFEMMNAYEFISDQYAGVIIEHTLGGGVFNYIPALKKLKWRQFWTAKGIIGSLSEANQELNLNKGFPFRTLQGNPYLELGTGVSNIFRIFRIDFDWRVTPAPLAGEAKSKYFGIFGSVVVQF